MFSLPQSSNPLSSPVGVILLRVLAFLICAFLVATMFCEFLDQPASIGVTPPKPKLYNETAPKNKSSTNVAVWQELLNLLPDKATENAKLAWQHGRANPLAVVSVGLVTCLTAIFLAGPAR